MQPGCCGLLELVVGLPLCGTHVQPACTAQLPRYHPSRPFCPLCSVVEALVSVRRVAEFLRCTETGGPCGEFTSSSCGSGRDTAASAPPAVRLEGSYTWGSSNGGHSGSGDSSGSNASGNGNGGATNSRRGASAAGRSAGAEPEQPGPVLRDIQLEVPAGTLVALTGTVGSGKSSLLAAMLGELLSFDSTPGKPAGRPKAGPTAGAFQRGQPVGTVASAGGCIAPGSSVAYAPQDAFILHGTLR